MERSLSYLKEEVIALESNMFSDTVGQLKRFVVDVYDSMSNRIKDIEYYFNGLPKDTDEFYKNLDYIESKFKDLNFFVLRERVVPIPEGFKGNYLDYTKRLISLSQSIQDKVPPLLKEYSVLISAIVNNGSDKLIMKDYNEIYKCAIENKDNLIKGNAEFFQDKKIAVAKIDDIIHNFEELTFINKDIHILLDKVKTENISVINKDMFNIHDKLELLISALSSNDLILNKFDIIDIGKGAYAIASYLEAVALHFYSVNIFLNRYEDLLVSLIKGK